MIEIDGVNADTRVVDIRAYRKVEEDKGRCDLPISLWGDSFFFLTMNDISRFAFTSARVAMNEYQALLNGQFLALELDAVYSEIDKLVGITADNTKVPIISGWGLVSRLGVKVQNLLFEESRNLLHMYEDRVKSSTPRGTEVIVFSHDAPSETNYELASVLEFRLRKNKF